MGRGNLTHWRGRARLIAAVAVAGAVRRACRLLGRGATSLPGLVALRIEPGLVGLLSGGLGRGSLVVAGTNGKTTTSALLAAALEAGGRAVLHNRAGSNMLRGIAATLCARAGLAGTLRGGAGLTGLFEVDEAALPGILPQISPRFVVLTNLFRDQLDRYGELQGIADRWRPVLASLPSGSRVLLNADDPLIASLGDALGGRAVYFGVDRWAGPDQQLEAPGSADSLFCPRCGAPLAFSRFSYAHLGHWSCPQCGNARPTPAISGIVTGEGGRGGQMLVAGAFGELVLPLALPGRYNAYNALAALAAALAAGVPAQVAVTSIGAATGVFGRAESIRVGDRSVQLYLIKNPTGADEVLRVVAGGDTGSSLLLLLSDLAADGHDVSWIWDARFDRLAGWSGDLWCGGTRAEDMALRCKYAGLGPVREVVPRDPALALRTALAGTAPGGTLVVLATYTAMLAARHSLARSGHVDPYWRGAGGKNR